MPMKVGVARETAAGERRVALVPEALGKLTAAGLEILVEAGAGAGAVIPDSAFTDAGATVVTTDELYAGSRRHPPRPEAGRPTRRQLRSGQAVIGLLQPLLDPALMETLAKAGVTAVSLDAIPRTLSRAQTMDALSLAGERRRLQGRPHRREHVRALLPAPDHRGRHRQARQRADPGDRRRGPPGDRHGAPPRRRRSRRTTSARRPREQAESLGAKFVRAQDGRSTRPAPAATPAS